MMREAGAEETRRLPHVPSCLSTPPAGIPLGGMMLGAVSGQVSTVPHVGEHERTDHGEGLVG